MRISFDLDDTLVCHQPGVPQEPRLPWYLGWLVIDEPLRRGAVDLMRQLRSRGWEIWIYTTSHRPESAVRRWLRCLSPGQSRDRTTAPGNRICWRSFPP